MAEQPAAGAAGAAAAAAATAAAPSAGVTKSLDRIAAQVAAGAFYEAQQMYKTTYYRCKARRAAADGYAVLAAGAAQQLASGQINCGCELGLMLVDAYAAANAPATAEALAALTRIVAALPLPLPPGGAASADASSELDETSRFVMAALKWARKAGAGEEAVRGLHDAYARWLWAALGWRGLGRAAAHFSRGADAAAYAAALAAAAEAGAPGGGEADLFLARAVLQTLACAHDATRDRQLQHAAALLEAAAGQAALAGAAESPLGHFCGLLLQALALRRPPLVALLQAHYAPSLERDPSLEAYVERIEQVYLGVRPPGGGGGVLGGLLRGLLEGDEFGDD